MNNKTLAITSFNKNIYESYAFRFIESFDGIDLKVYSEDSFQVKTEKLYLHEEFVKRNSHIVTDDFKFDAVRFCFKPYTIAQAINEFGADYTRLLWLDADTIFFKPITEAWVDKNLHTKPALLSYLGRPNWHSETGVLLFETNHKYTKEYIERVIHYYDSDEIFKEKEWHDSYIWDLVRKQYPKKYFNNLGVSYRVPGGHIQAHLFGDSFDHTKGSERKAKGYSIENLRRPIKK